MKGPCLDWTEDNQLYAYFKAWRERVEMLVTGMALKKEPQEFICHCIKAWSGKTHHTHIEVVCHTGDDATRTKCLLDTIKGHFKSRSNGIAAVRAYRQLVQGDLGLPEYIEKCKDVTAACYFCKVYDKCLTNAILPGPGNQLVYKKCIEVGE